MANVIEVLIKGLVSDDFKKALDQASQSVEGFANKVSQAVESASKRFEGMNKGLDSLGKLIIGIGAALSIGITAPTVALANGSVQAGANIEKLTIAFQPLLGSAQAAAQRMGELQKFANLTPFELPEVAKASRMLEVMTKGVLATGDALRMVGDIASGVGQGFDEVAMWVGRLYDGLKSGRPVGEATMRLQEMGAMSGDTRNKLEQMAASGAKFSDVWAVATQAFGRFAGGMELQANSVEGKISTLHDSAQTALASLGRSFEGVTKTILDLLTSLTDKLGALAEWFGRLPEPVKVLALAIGALAAAIGPLLAAFGAMLIALPSLISGWATLTAAITAAQVAFAPMIATIAAFAAPVAMVVAALGVWAIAIYRIRDAWKEAREEQERTAGIEKATDDALARRGVGLEHRQALRKAGYDVGVGSETSQSQQGGSFAAFQQQRAAAQADSDEAAAKIHAEFIKTDRASLIAVETKKYEEQKKALGDNAEALKQLNVLHKQALEDIDKKTLPKAKADPEAKAARDLAISQAQDRFRIEQDAAAQTLQVRRETVLASITNERERELEALAQRMDREMAAANGNKALLLALHDQARAQRAEINRKWDEKDLQEAIKKNEKETQEAEKKLNLAKKREADAIKQMKDQMAPLISGINSFATAIGGVANQMTQLAIRGDFTLKKFGKAVKDLFIGILADLAAFIAQLLVKLALLLMLDALTGGMVSVIMGAGKTAGGGGVGGKGGFTGMLGKLAGFDVGTPYVPRDMIAQIHEGEMIIPKTFAQGLRDGDVPVGGNRSASLVLGSDIIRALKTEGRALVQITENQGRVSFS